VSLTLAGPESGLALLRDAAPRFGEVLSVSKGAFHRIAYTEWGDPSSRRLALCVHGLTRQGRDFDPLAVTLANQGYRVICPDLVGRGRSGWLVEPDEYNLPQYCLDMTVLLAKFPYDTLDWIGTSLGGLTGICMAGVQASPVSRLVINDVGPYVGWQALFRIGTYLRQAPAEFASLAKAEQYHRTTYAPFGNLTEEEWRFLTIHSVKKTEDGRYRMRCDPEIGRAFNPALLYNLTLWRFWDAITCPVLVLRGEHSDLLSRKTAHEMERRGPKATLVDIPDCGHAPALLDLRQIGVVAEWLTETSPR
jgi:pimeloyl-ACP methyl ester carboxylesterase